MATLTSDGESAAADSEPLTQEEAGPTGLHKPLGNRTFHITGSSSATRRKRRRHTDGVSSAPRSKRLRGCYSDNYRQLFNSSVEEINDRFSEKSITLPSASTIGVSKWSSKEKDVFFGALSKLGADDLPGIAQAIGTKSIPEVQEYLFLLRDGLIEEQTNEAENKLAHVTDIPAAAEISEACCEVLDKVAEALAWNQEKWEAKQEQLKYGDSWLLDRSVSLRTKTSYDTDNESDDTNFQEERDRDRTEDSGTEEEERLDIPSMTLLKLDTWLELSEWVFMNSGPPEESQNWRAIADPEQVPAMYRTAFEDFFTLAVSTTRRLVQASLFQAMSRLRSADYTRSSAHTIKPYVRRRDVVTALDVLGMKTNSHEFWRKAPRRCQLQVYEDPPLWNKDNDVGEPFDYDQVEKLLNHVDPTDTENSTQNIAEVGVFSPERASFPESSDDVVVDDDTDMDEIEDKDSGLHDTELEHDEYANAFDYNAGLLEEQALWDLVETRPPADVKYELKDLPKRPRMTRNTKVHDIYSWRYWTNYRAQWESGTMFHPTETTSDTRPSLNKPEGTVMKFQQEHTLPSSMDTEKLETGSTNREIGQPGNEDSVHLSRRIVLPRRARDTTVTQIENEGPLLAADESSGDDYDPSA